MNFKGTPGPWHIGQGKNTGARTIIADDETWVGFSYGTRLGVCTVEAAEANAKLIAAAPSLLKALDRLRRAHDVDGIELTEALIEADHAINKALTS